jgi:hypothetical protein
LGYSNLAGVSTSRNSYRGAISTDGLDVRPALVRWGGVRRLKGARGRPALWVRYAVSAIPESPPSPALQTVKRRAVVCCLPAGGVSQQREQTWDANHYEKHVEHGEMALIHVLRLGGAVVKWPFAFAWPSVKSE